MQPDVQAALTVICRRNKRLDRENVNLARADLRGADLANASLALADLRGVDLADAPLYRADLAAADLTNADLTGAYLEGETSRCDPHRRNFSGATIFNADLTDPALAWQRPHGRFVKKVAPEGWVHDGDSFRLKRVGEDADNADN